MTGGVLIMHRLVGRIARDARRETNDKATRFFHPAQVNNIRLLLRRNRYTRPGSRDIAKQRDPMFRARIIENVTLRRYVTR